MSGVRGGALARGDELLHALARRARASRRRHAGGIRGANLGEVLISRRLLDEAEHRARRRAERLSARPSTSRAPSSRRRSSHVSHSSVRTVDAAVEDLGRIVDEAVVGRQRVLCPRSVDLPRRGLRQTRRIGARTSTRSTRPSARSGSSRHRSRRTSRASVRSRWSQIGDIHGGRSSRPSWRSRSRAASDCCTRRSRRCGSSRTLLSCVPTTEARAREALERGREPRPAPR